MLRIFTPDYRVRSLDEISAEFLRSQGARGVIADLDNTLALPADPAPTGAAIAWLREMHESGIGIVVLSNASRARVAAFCDPLGLDFICRGGKPLTRGFKKAAALLGLPIREIIILGDQVFTDVLGARVAGMKSALIAPITIEGGWFFRAKRALERWVTG